MGMGKKIILFIFELVFLPYLARASDKILINIHLFQGMIEDRAGLNQVEILSASSRPELSFLKDKAAGSESELTAAIIDLLLDLYDMQTIEDIFAHEKAWNGMGKPILEDFVFGCQDQASYQIKLSPRRLPSQRIALRTVILKTEKSEGGWEPFIDQDLVLDIGDPVIVSVPYQDRVYFMMVLLTIGSPSERWRDELKKARKREPVHLVSMPNAIVKAAPSYPEELRRRGIGGQVDLRVIIDEKGVVQGVEVVKPAHPYFNYLAVRAVRQWRFEPYLFKGKPVAASFPLKLNFNPRLFWEEMAWSETRAQLDPSSRKELGKILDGCGDYCEKLRAEVFDFICQETIKETHYNLLKNIKWMLMWIARQPGQVEPDHFDRGDVSLGDAAREEQTEIQQKVVGAAQIFDPKKTQRNNFLCDYLIVKKAGRIEERRIILKENGRPMPDRNKILEEKRFIGLSSLFAPLRVMAGDRQSRFAYRLIKGEEINGKMTNVIEAMPKSENDDCIWSAKIWVDTNSFKVLKCEIEGIPIDGYEDVLNDCAILNIKPIFLITHEYRQEKNGILFPYRSKVRVAYPGIDFRGPIDKIKINFSYDKYKFFTVETDGLIIKQELPAYQLLNFRNPPVLP